MKHSLPIFSNYYDATAQRDKYPELQGEYSVDVCVIGGGIAGCSTALHLAEKGYRVALMESDCIGYGASGRSGGQLLPGFSCGQPILEKQLGADTARALWDISVEAIQLAVSLIKQHHIECDLKFGHIDVAIKHRHHEELLRHRDHLQQEYGYQDLRMMESSELRYFINSDRYIAGLFYPAAAHIHPLNYTMGLARAAAKTGAVIFERSKVVGIEHSSPGVSVRTKAGTVNAQYVVMCANVGNVALTKQSSRIMPVATYMIATGPLAVDQLVMNDHIAASDCNFILDYFRMSNDRLLFGGGVSYSGHANTFRMKSIENRMLKVFPQLRDHEVEYAWHGLLDISLNRAPDFGRINSNIYYLQGFSGHGLALATIAGKLVADSIAMQSEQFDLFNQINHRSFPGGSMRTPLLMLAMLWYRVRDAL